MTCSPAVRVPRVLSTGSGDLLREKWQKLHQWTAKKAGSIIRQEVAIPCRCGLASGARQMQKYSRIAMVKKAELILGSRRQFGMRHGVFTMSEFDPNMDTPSIRLRQPGLLVYLCGIATSILTIFAVHWVNRNGTYIMGWFVNGILPGGAILVGIVSGSGYAIGSRVFHVKLSKLFLAVMFATGILDYFAVEYLTYTSVIGEAGVPAEAYSFVDYMRDQAEKMTFQDRHDRVPGQPLGIWGYCFQLLIVLGFAVGADGAVANRFEHAVLSSMPGLSQESSRRLPPLARTMVGRQSPKESRAKDSSGIDYQKDFKSGSTVCAVGKPVAPRRNRGELQRP